VVPATGEISHALSGNRDQRAIATKERRERQDDTKEMATPTECPPAGPETGLPAACDQRRTKPEIPVTNPVAATAPRMIRHDGLILLRMAGMAAAPNTI
jgi:hypothetical protein